jgi:hypothetical protein
MPASPILPAGSLMRREYVWRSRVLPERAAVLEKLCVYTQPKVRRRNQNKTTRLKTQPARMNCDGYRANEPHLTTTECKCSARNHCMSRMYFSGQKFALEIEGDSGGANVHSN